MGITLHLPPAAEDAFRKAFGPDLGQAAKEALVIEGYRTVRLSLGQVAAILGLETRHDAESWLGRRGINWNYTQDDLDADRRTIDELFGRSRS